MPGAIGTVLVELGFQVADLAHDHPGVLEQALSGLCQFGAAAGPIQQMSAQLALQGLDPNTGSSR
ncbi:hypothetical protein D3C72_2177400 [compost metagenome]